MVDRAKDYPSYPHQRPAGTAGGGQTQPQTHPGWGFGGYQTQTHPPSSTTASNTTPASSFPPYMQHFTGYATGGYPPGYPHPGGGGGHPGHHPHPHPHHPSGVAPHPSGFHFPPEYNRPLPAHSPMTSHLKALNSDASTGTSSPSSSSAGNSGGSSSSESSPLPAHMRSSNPYPYHHAPGPPANHAYHNHTYHHGYHPPPHHQQQQHQTQQQQHHPPDPYAHQIAQANSQQNKYGPNSYKPPKNDPRSLSNGSSSGSHGYGNLPPYPHSDPYQSYIKAYGGGGGGNHQQQPNLPPTGSSILASVMQPRGPTIDARAATGLPASTDSSKTNGGSQQLSQTTKSQHPPVDLTHLQPVPPSQARGMPGGPSFPPLGALPSVVSSTSSSTSTTPKLSHSVASQLNNNSKDEVAGNKRKLVEPANSSVDGKCKKPKLDPAEDDPYSFDEEEKTAAAMPRFFGNKKTAAANVGPGSGPVYKFKSALLSRESRASSTDSRCSSTGSMMANKTVPMAFEKEQDSFLETCERLLDDLTTKPIHMSKRPCLEAHWERMAILAGKPKRGRKRKEDILAAEAAKATASGASEANGEVDMDHTESEASSSAKSTPTKKSSSSPGKKKKHQSGEAVINDDGVSERPKESQSKPKKGGLWALPIVPKLPQKPTPPEKRKSSGSPVPPTKSKKDSGSGVDLCDVWRQAFGGAKTKTKQDPSGQASAKQDSAEPKKKTFLDIPPEVRRRPRPNFGGLIHFAPDWEHRVRRHHEKCRLPHKLRAGMGSVKPTVLTSGGGPGVSTPIKSSFEKAPSISPQDKPSASLTNDDLSPPRLMSQISPVASTANPSTSLVAAVKEEPLPSAPMSVVDSILEKRKLRMGIGRMYKVPFMKEKKKQKVAFDKLPEEGIGLIPTPGIPLLTNETSGEALMGSNFSSFRRQTLLRYLDSLEDAAELKAKILDWKPEVFETKTRRQANQIKTVSNYKEIFGIDLPVPGSTPTEDEQVESPVKEEDAKKKEGKTPKKTPKKKKKEPKEIPEDKKPIDQSIAPGQQPLPDSDKASKFAEEDYIPNEAEEELQTQLQGFALDLLNDNPSWERRTVIQNLVIWEPIDPVIPLKKVYKRKSGGVGKKARKRHSGLDFGKRKSGKGGGSRDISRAATPEKGAPSSESHAITYSLEDVTSECKSYVVDKKAGETVLHRAARQGHPDVTAYLLDIERSDPRAKDNAGIPPIHKAAYRGHAEVVEILMRYGVDPSTNVKGTRPLHEALEGGSLSTVHTLLRYGADPLLYDYSGNMPIDLTEENPEMKRYLTAILADLHGKPGERYAVDPKDLRFLIPKDDQDDGESDDDDGFVFETSAHPLPPFFQFPDREGHFVLISDLKDYLHGKLDEKKLETILDMNAEDFSRSSHCSLLGQKKSSAPASGTMVQLTLVDATVKKMLSIETSSPIKKSTPMFEPSVASPPQPSSSSPSKSRRKS